MNLKRVCQLEFAYSREIADLFSRAASYKSHCDTLTVERVKLRQDILKHKMPRYARSYLFGYEQALAERYWHTEVIWKFPWYGTIYDKWSHLPEAGKAYYHLAENTGFHVYVSDNQKVFTGDVAKFNLLFASIL